MTPRIAEAKERYKFFQELEEGTIVRIENGQAVTPIGVEFSLNGHPAHASVCPVMNQRLDLNDMVLHCVVTKARIVCYGMQDPDELYKNFDPRNINRVLNTGGIDVAPVMVLDGHTVEELNIATVGVYKDTNNFETWSYWEPCPQT